MKIYTRLGIAGLALGLLISCKPSTPEAILNPSGFKIVRGVNLSHWLSQDFGWEPKYTYISEHDIRFIDSIGYDHVRIPIDEMEMWDTAGHPNEVAFDHLVQCLDWCARVDLKAIVDMHILRAHHFNAANEGGTNTLWTDTAAQQHLIDLWLQVSERLKDYPNHMVAYEILNEAVAPEHDDWNRLMNKVVSAIRHREPERVLVIGPNMWQIAPNMQYLKIPEGDKNIILSFHTYTPLAFTHYKADWTPLRDYEGKVRYPGQIITGDDFTRYADTSDASVMRLMTEGLQEFNKEKLAQVYATAVEFAQSKNLQLYCGEFGCLPTVEREDRLQYYRDMISSFGEYDIAWCNWEYKGDFGIYFFDMEKKVSLNPDTTLISVLLGGKR